MHQAQFAMHAAIEDEHWWFRVRRRIMADCLPPPAAEAPVLAEIGCGTGGNLRYFAHAGWVVVGVDSDAEAVRLARERSSVEVLQGDFREQLADRWDRVGAVVLADVLEHVADDRGFLADTLDAMRPGATLVITVPALSWLWSHHDEVLGHHRRYDRAGLLRLLEAQQRIDTVYVTYFNSVLFPLIALIRLADRFRRRRAGEESDLQAVHPALNAVLGFLFGLEHPLLRRRMRLPVGASLLAVVRKR